MFIPSTYLAFVMHQMCLFTQNAKLHYMLQFDDTVKQLQFSTTHTKYTPAIYSNVASPICTVRRGKVKKPSRFWPFLPDFSSFFLIFLSFSNFWQFFSLSGVALCLHCTPSGYATANKCHPIWWPASHSHTIIQTIEQKQINSNISKQNKKKVIKINNFKYTCIHLLWFRYRKLN